MDLGPDADARYSIAASSVRGVLAFAKVARVPTNGLLAEVGLSEDALEGPEARISQRANDRIWEMLAERSGDPHFGLHAAEHLSPESFGVVGHLVAHSATLGEGLERAVARSRILHDAGRTELERDGPLVLLYPGCRGLPFRAPRHIAEFNVAACLVLARQVTSSELMPRGVCFEHPAPASTSEHRRILGVAPSFLQPETVVILEAAALRLPISDPRAGVLTYLDAHARDVIARLPEEEDLLGQVERTIASSMSRGAPDLAQTAQRLGMSARTLQRRLATYEVSYQTLVDGVRRTFAERYLSDDRLPLAEIAFLLGFADVSNFHRAFRRWTGKTPSMFREEHRAAQPTGHGA